VEGIAEDTVGGGEEGNREVDGPVEDPGPAGRREVQPGGTRLPLLYGCGKAGTGRGGGCCVRVIFVGGVGVAGGAASGAERLGTAVPPVSLYHGGLGRGVGGGLRFRFFLLLSAFFSSLILCSWDRPGRR